MSLLIVLSSDLRHFVGEEALFVSKLKCVCFAHAFHLVVLYRVGVLFSAIPIVGSGFRILMEYFIRIFFASDISLKSQIGAGLMIIHGHDIVIGGDVRIGKNCKILNGVTLGNKDTENPVNAQPTLGDNVVIGSGAKILGDIVIGDHVIIGANSVVVKNVPSNVTVAGVPARVIWK